MDNRTKLYCTILKAGLWGDHLDLNLSKEEFKQVWTDATRQVTRGIIGSVLVSSGAVPSNVVDRIQDWMLLIGGENYKISRVLSESLKALANQGIEPVLLKGHGVAPCYPTPMLREVGDIDFYVGTENYRKSFDALSDLSDSTEEPQFEENSKHSHVDIKGIPVEIHQYCEVLPRKYNALFQEIAKDGLSSGNVYLELDDVDCKVRIPEPTFNSFFLFNHIWRHFVTEGVGFRQVCDWTMFLHANAGSVDDKRLMSILKSLDLLRAWQVFGRVAVDVLGLPENEMPLCSPVSERIVNRVVDMMLKEGNFGHSREDWWTVPRESLFDKVRVFFMIAKRYIRLIPSFGSVVFYEYLDRMRRKFF